VERTPTTTSGRAAWRRPLAAVIALAAAAAAGCGGAAGPGEPPPPPSVAGQPPAASTAELVPGGEPIVFEDGWVGVALASEEVVVGAELDGQLRSIDVEVGRRVEAGQRLATVDARELREQIDQARASLAALSAEHRRHEVELDSLREQVERRQGYEELYSVEEVAELKSRRRAAAAALDAAAARVEQEQAYLEQLRGRIGRAELVAPIAGTVAERYLDPGALVRPGTPVIRLISSRSLIARFAVPPEEAAALSVGQPIEFRSREPAAVVAGVLTHVAPDVDAAAQMVFAEASLGAGAGPPLQPGTVGAVRPANGGPAASR